MNKKLFLPSTRFRALRRLYRCRKGTSAIEFALIIPIIAAMLITISDVANIMVGASTMQTVARSAIQYAMNGGTDMNAAQNIAMQSWNSPPNDAAISAVQACFCGGSGADCNTPCPDQSVPQNNVTVTVSGTYGGDVMQKKSTVVEKVRLR
ncbi:MAG TPA: TadE/TadG family type IV pilus assembly protein [Micropepsaceae bacterium]|nr:TadE/TadG family type IV pilus assembly protein [Micropepsaceae bacterium]